VTTSTEISVIKYQSLNLPNEQDAAINASPAVLAYKQEKDFFFDKDENNFPI
jgi:hypothetical protein